MLTLGIIGDILFGTIRNIFLGLDVIIYKFINYLYQVFITLASARIFKDVNFMEIIDRVYIVIGVVMLFVTAYSLLTAIINPDNIAKGEMSAAKLVPNMIVSIVLIAIVPTIFNLMYQAQDIMLSQNIIGKAILGGTYDEKDPGYTFEALGENGQKIPITTGEIDNNQTLLQSSGKIMSATIFRAFFVPTVESDEPGVDPATLVKNDVSEYFSYVKGPVATALSCISGGDTGALPNVLKDIPVLSLVGSLSTCVVNLPISVVKWAGDTILDFLGFDTGITWTLAQADLYAEVTGDIGIYTAFMDNANKGEIEYSWFFASAAGIFVCWTLLAYCIDLGVRAVKLAFYQLIAPIPILCRMIPKQKKIFDNWVKIVLITFAEVFVRVAVIYFVIYLCSIIATTSVFDNFWTNSILGTPPFMVRVLARVAIILGLLAFAKQAPKLITDLMGIDSKNMSLGINIGKKLGENGALAIPTAVGGAFTGGVRRFMNPSEGRSGWQRFTDSVSAAGRGGAKGAKTGWTAKSFGDVQKGAASAAGDAVAEQKRTVEDRARDRREKEAWINNPENEGKLYTAHKLHEWAEKGGVDYQENALSRYINYAKAFEDLYKTPKDQSKDRIKSVIDDLAKAGHYVDPEGFMKSMKNYDTAASAQQAINNGSIRGAIADQVQRYIKDGTYSSEYQVQKEAEQKIKGIKAVETEAAIKDLGKHMERVASLIDNINSELSTSGAIGQKTVDALKKAFAADDKKAIFDMSKISTVPELTEQLKKMVTTVQTQGEKSIEGEKALRALKMVVEESKKANTDALANLKDEIARQKKDEKK